MRKAVTLAGMSLRYIVCFTATLTTLVALVASQQPDRSSQARQGAILSATPGITGVELYEPEHYSPDTLLGGRGGGTRIRLLGNNLLNPDGSFDTSISVTVGGQPAALVPFFSTSRQLVVDTPAKPPQIPDCCHSFQVFNRNGEIRNELSASKRFKYEKKYTPYLHGIVPSAASPGDEVHILGSFPWWRLRMDSNPPDDPRRLILRAQIGPYRCLFPWSDDAEDVQLENYLDSIPCRIPDTAMPGYYNVSVTIGDIYGTTVPWKPVFEVSQPGYGSDRSVNTYWPSLSGALGVHMLQVIPKIDNVEVHSGSRAGGQLVKVDGHGFGTDISAVRIDAAGVPCKVLKADRDGLVCLTDAGSGPVQQRYLGGAGVHVAHYAEIERSITGNSSVTKSTVASHMNLPYTTSPYRVRMDTTFSAPFTGVGYFIGAFDDFVDMHLAALNADGEAVTEDELVISSSYVGRGWTRSSNQQSRDFNFTYGEQYRLQLDHGNVGGAGYFDLALVHRGAPPSWSAERGEQHIISLHCNFTGEQHRLDLGPITNGTFKLEIGYTNIEGLKQIALTQSIDVDASTWSIEAAARRRGVMLKAERSTTESGSKSILFTFGRPSIDNAGFTIHLRGLNVTCDGQCTARSGDQSEVVQQESPFDWNTSVSIAWNGRSSPVIIPSYLIDSSRSDVHTDVLKVLQAIPGVPAAYHDVRQSAGGLDAKVSGDIFSGAQITYTWPAFLGHLAGLHHFNDNSDTTITSHEGNQGNVTVAEVSARVVGPGQDQYQVSTTIKSAITDAWHHPIDASVFTVAETRPQVVVHVNGMRATCRSQDGCHYMPLSNHTAVISSVHIDGPDVVISGSGFGNETTDGQYVPPISIGTVLCASSVSSWTDTEIRCILDTELLPGTSIVQVHVPGKGFAAQQSGQPFIVSTTLASPVSTVSQGSFGGGWPLAFHSPSSQLGRQPRSVYVRFSRQSDSASAEVYIMPDPDGDTSRLHALLCTSRNISKYDPVPAFLGLDPVLDRKGDTGNLAMRQKDVASPAAETSDNSTMPQSQAMAKNSVQTIAGAFNITTLPGSCLYYAGSGLWSLDAGQLVVPAPPSAVFAALLSSIDTLDSSTAQRRLSAESDSESESDSAVTAELYVNSQNISSTGIAYDSTVTPNVTNAVPQKISAAASQIIRIQGQGFSANVTDTHVWLGSRGCYVRSVTTTTITCRARGGGTFGPLPITVKTGGVFAASSVSVTGVLYISAISQAYGSLAGGSILEISGDGFADEYGTVTTNFVSIGLPPAAPCRVLSASPTRIMCQTEPAGRMHAGALPERLNPLEVSVNGVYAQCRAPPVCTPGCNSTMASEGGAEKCCNFQVPDPSQMDPLPFIGDDQGYGADNCSFYYTKHATPNVTGFTPHVAAGGELTINVSMYGMHEVYAIPMAEADVTRWMNAYREDSDGPEAVMLPDLWAEPLFGGSGLLNFPVTRRSSTHVSAAIPEDIAMGSYQIVVWIASLGAAIMPTRQGPLVQVSAQLLSIQPAALPRSGGMIVVYGTGFPRNPHQISLVGHGFRWEVLNSTATMITAYSPGGPLQPNPPFSLTVVPAHLEVGDCDAEQSECPLPVIAPFELGIGIEEAVITAVHQAAPGAEVVMSVRANSDLGVTTEAYLTNRSVTVMLGMEALAMEVVIINETDASITISKGTVAELPASPGGHSIFVMVDGSMVSGISPVVHVPLSVTSVSPSLGSMAGGTQLNITGHGFNNMTDGTMVSVCNLACRVTAVPSSSKLHCVTPAVTLASPGPLPVTPLQVSGSGTSGERSMYPASLMFDGGAGYASEWRSSEGRPCEFVVDWHPYEAELTLVRILIPAELAGRSSSYEPQQQLTGMTIDVSPNATDGSWQRVGNGTSAAPFATGWTEVNLEPTQMYRFVRIRMDTSSRCAIAEAGFEGRMRPSGSLEQCNVTASVVGRQGSPSVTATLARAYTFAVSHTPTVTAVTPAYGSAAGGTPVTIQGTNLPESMEDALVEIDGITCEVTSASAEALECITGERPVVPEVQSFRVASSSSGNATIMGEGFKYKDLWSSRVTWAGEPPPMEGESIVIPAGQTILFDLEESPRLRLLLVEGQLEFLDSAHVHLHAEWIMVRGVGSALTVGREDAPFRHSATITLHGRRSTAREIPSYGAKNIAVRYGTLDLHGLAKTPTWTRLGATAQAGSDTVMLVDPVNWVAGDEIAIASSAWDPSEVEQRRIVSVSSDGRTLTLDKRLWFQHWGELVEIGGRTIDMRAEVGCLSRNVLIQGDAESVVDQYGAHIMISSPPRGRVATSVGRISQIECFRCGQAFMLGRYPLHFHMMGDVHDSYIRGAAVHHTYNRAVTIHGVHYLRVEDVVAYDNMGHTFFIEDAIESQNRIVHNLALWTRKSMSLLDTDTTPASFWITFPTNYFYNNSAAGSERYGFWFDLQAHPTGPSHTRDICPPGEPLGAFEDNTAHSNVRYGLRVFNFWVPLAPGSNPCRWTWSWYQQYPRTATLLRYTGYKNGRTGLMLSLAGDVRCEGCALIDNMRAGAELNRMAAPYGTTGTYNTIIGINSPAMAGRNFPHFVRDDPDAPQTYGWIVSGFTNNQVVANTTFSGFTGPTAFAFSTCDHCNFPNSKNQGAKTTHFANITYIDTDSFVFYGSRLNAILHDMDGTLSGYPAGTHMTHHDWPHLQTSCPVGARPGWETSVVCPLTKRLIRLAIDYPKPFDVYKSVPVLVRHAQALALDSLRPQDMNQQGSARSAVEFGNVKVKENHNGWAMVLVSDEHYHLWWDTINPIPEYLRFEATDMLSASRANATVPEGIVVTLPYDDVWPYLGVISSRGEAEATDLGLVNSRVDRTGNSYRSYENNTLSLLFSGRGNPGRGWWWNQRLRVYGAQCPPEGCPPPEEVSAVRTGPLRKWSNRTMWEELPEDVRPRLDAETGLPAAGTDVKVPAAWRIELDADTAVGHLELDGELSFPRGRDIVLSVETLKMSVGELKAGTKDRPHDSKVTLRVGSTAQQRAPVARRLSAIGGPSILEVLGKINLHGTSSLPQRSHLAAPAAAGDAEIFVTESALWQPGEEIFLTSTGHDYREAEYALVASCNGTTVTLQAPLRFSHFGAPDIFRDDSISNKTKFSGMENRAQVLLMTRSITIDGGGEARSGRGAKMLIAELESETEERGIPVTTIYRGSLDVSNIAFRGMGQIGTGRAALTILSTSDEIAVHNSTFSHCFGPGIEVRSAGLANLTSNVVVDTEGPSIAVWNDGKTAQGVRIPVVPRAVVVNNVGGFARILGVDVLFDSVSAFVLCPFNPRCDITAEGNVAAGSGNYGFVFGRAGTCDVDDSAAIANTAHSCRVGFLYLIAAAFSCSRISNAIVHHTTEVGMVYDREGMSMQVEHVLLADNRLGLAVMPGAERAITTGFVSITQSAVIGYSNNGGCGFDATIACPRTCGRNGFPLYAEDGDLACGPRIGFSTSVWFNNPKPWPRTPPCMGPWWDVDADAALGGYTRIHNVALVNWPQQDDCGCRHFAIAPNPSSGDLSPTTFVSAAALSNVSSGAQYHSPPPDPELVNFEDCVDFECTGLSHAVLVDTDGSLTGAPASVVRGDTALVTGDSRAVYNELMDAIVVTGGSYRELYFESLDPDRMSRRVQPVAVTGAGAAAGRSSSARLNCFEDHLWDFDYTSLLRMSRFAATVELGGNYTITYAGTPPQQQQFSMSGNAPEEGVLIRLKYSVAQTFKVRVRGERMQLPSVVPVSLADPAGANHWSMDSFELTVVVKGSQPILIRQLPMVRISMALEMDIETFLTTPTATFTTGLAFALQLDPSTIRVTGYRSRGNRRRSLTDASGGRGGIDLTFAVIPAEALQDSPPPPPAAPPPPPLAPGEAAGTPVAEDSDVIVFDPTSVRALSEAVAAATAALQEIDIAGVTVATSSLVTEVQEPVAAECSPPCKTAEANGITPSCIDQQCVCTDSGYTYYDATADFLNATRPSGCYVPSPPPYPAGVPYPPPSATTGPPSPGSLPPESRLAVLLSVRFTEMAMDEVTAAFERALCDVTTARILAALSAIPDSAAPPEHLGCDVVSRAGSVIADATVIMPSASTSAVISATTADLTANIGADISGDALLGTLGMFDPPTSSSYTLTVSPVNVVPVIADMPTLEQAEGMLEWRVGSPITLVVTFTVTEGGSTRNESVSGFSVNDVVASAESPNGMSLVLSATAVVEMEPSWYRLQLEPQVAAWPEEALRSCDDWIVTVRVVERAAVNSAGDMSLPSATVQLMWRPALDSICAQKSDDSFNFVLLGGVLGGVIGLLITTGAVVLMWARCQFRRARVGLATADAGV